MLFRPKVDELFTANSIIRHKPVCNFADNCAIHNDKGERVLNVPFDTSYVMIRQRSVFQYDSWKLRQRTALEVRCTGGLYGGLDRSY